MSATAVGAALRFTIAGQPVPQGSKSAIRTGSRTVVVESNRAKLRPYRGRVADAAAAAMAAVEGDLLSGPVRLSLVLYFQRPQSHYRVNGDLKGSAPEYVAKRPDADKVARAIADALTGIVYRDDSQVASLHVLKLYGETPRAEVEVEAML